MPISSSVWQGLKQVFENSNRTPKEMAMLAILGCVVAAAFKYPDRAFLTKARPDLRARNADVPGWPLIGNLPDIIRDRHDPLQGILDTFEEHGDVVSMTLPGVGRVVLVNDPVFMEYILKTNFENYVKGEFFRFQLADILGKGIFVSDGQQWRFHRKTASNMFTTRLYRSLVEGAFKDSVLDFMTYCFSPPTHANSSSTSESLEDNSVIVDLQALFPKLTLDAFGKLTFGLEFKALASTSSQQKIQKKGQDDEQPNEFGEAFDYLTVTADARTMNPLWPITDRIFFWNQRRLDKAIGVLDKWAVRAVRNRRRETPEEKEQRPRDLLDHFIHYKNDEDGTMLTDQDLRDVFVNFMIAGRDTTAQALTWQFYSLMADSRVMQNLVREVDQVLQGSTDQLTYEVLMHEMPYAKAVFHETLRLYPPVPKNLKQVVADDVLPDGTRVFAGEMIGYSTWSMGRNKKIWGEDAHLFLPERWLHGCAEDPVEGVEGKAGVSPFGKFKPENQFKFNSFNAGPRLCLGQQFATLEALVTTCMLLQNYEFKLAPGQSTPKAKGSVTLPMKDPLLTVVTPRVKEE
ncbi:hypothetical protein BGZ94_004227 [Podila epigama]|nr:hypothetical protein BGZ94_004227 [Podila epigama]